MNAAKIFVSYSHDDLLYFKALDARLRFLNEMYVLEPWSDRETVAGEEWRGEIEKRLHEANIIVLLVSPAFRSSDFISRVEVPIALERRRTESAIVIAVLVRPSGWPDYKPLNCIEALPKSDNGSLIPVSNWTNADDAWETVQKALNAAFQKFGVPTRMEHDLATAVRAHIQGAKARPDRIPGCTVVKYERVTDFWSAEPRHQDGRLVSLTGTLSRYAPLVIGPPTTKREMHLAFRHKLSAGLPQEREGRINSMLAFTAGQMVWRLELSNIDSVYLGFYHSIVRNAIPVFVDRQYYLDRLEPMLASYGGNALDVRLTGRVTRLSNDFIASFTDDAIFGTSIIRPRILPLGDRPNYGIVVDGAAEASIESIGRTKYLDGDIWVALKWENRRLFHSRFCDIADAADLAQQAQALKGEITELYPGYELILQFDQVNPHLFGHQALRVKELVEQMF